MLTTSFFVLLPLVYLFSKCSSVCQRVCVCVCVCVRERERECACVRVRVCAGGAGGCSFVFSTSLSLAGNSDRLTRVRHSSLKNSATHSYQCDSGRKKKKIATPGIRTRISIAPGFSVCRLYPLSYPPARVHESTEQHCPEGSQHLERVGETGAGRQPSD